MNAAGRLTRSGLLAVAFLLLLAGCTGSDGDGATSTMADETATTVPADTTLPAASGDDSGTTAPGEEENAPEEEAGEGDEQAAPVEDREPSEVPVWGWVLAALLLTVAVVWMASRSGAQSSDG